MKHSKLYFSVALSTLLLFGCNSQSSKSGEQTKDLSSTNKSFPTVTEQGVGELKIGTPLAECLIVEESSWPPTKEEITSCNETKCGFYNKMGIKQMALGEGTPYFLLYDNDELMAALECYSLMDNGIYSTNVGKIVVYSPKLKMDNGIYVGMTAKDMADKFGADIKFAEGAEADVLEFEVADIPSNIMLVASAKKINKEKTESEYGEVNINDSYLTLNDVEDCVLSAIVIEQNTEADGTY